MLESPTPLRVLSLWLLLEDGFFLARLKFDNAVLFIFLAAQQNICPEIAAQIELKADFRCDRDVQIQRAYDAVRCFLFLKNG